MADAYGNVMRAPGTSTKARVNDVEVLYSYSPPPLKKGGTLKVAVNGAGGTALQPGLPMAYVTATKTWQPALAAGTDAVAFLVTGVDSGAASDIPKQINFIARGVVKLDVVLAAINLYYGSAITTLPAGLVTALGAKVNTDYGYISF
jgi:hypothetical protein